MDTTALEQSMFESGPGPVILDLPMTLSAKGDGKCLLNSRWVSGRGLAVYSQWNVDRQLTVSPELKGKETCHMTGKPQLSVYEVQWECSKWNRTTRKFVNQTHGYFMSLQKSSQKDGGLESKDLLKYCQLYRSALHECVLSLKKMAAEDEEKETDYTEEVSLYSLLELVWHLCEVLFIETLPDGCLVQQLLEWIRWHSDGTEDELISSILATHSPGDHADFWAAVYRLVLRGRLSEARNLLAQHTLTQLSPQAHASIDELLRKAPMIQSTGTLSRAALQRRWSEWRSEVVRRRKAGDFIALPELDLLAAILCGEDEVFGDEVVVGCCNHWYELMVAKLLYTFPLVTSADYDLIYIADSAVKMFSSLERGAVDDIIMAALRFDVMELVKLCSSSFSNWWMVAHLSNLLNHRGLFVASKLEYGSKMSEFFLLEYASSLSAHPSLWQVAMGYLSECPQQGRAYMEAYIQRIPLETSKKASKVLRLCEKYELKEQAASVCRVQAMKACKNGRLGMAMSWCIRSNDSAFAAYLAEKYMENYKVEGEFMDLDLLDHLGDAILLNERLMFLAKYREYHQLYENSQFVEAGKLLVTLLLSNTVPTRFWATLLTDALLLMENDEIVFSSEQTYALSHLVQQLTLSTDKSNQSDPIPKLVTTETFSLLNLALARNLSRAILEEHTI